MAVDNKSYRGFCHCGAFRFQLNVPEIKEAMTCDCRLCSKNGYLWIVPSEGSFKVTRDDGLLRAYESQSLKHQFCTVCATGIYGEHLSGPMKGQTAVNLRAVQGLDPFKIEPPSQRQHVDEDPVELPSLELEEGSDKAYHRFSCHCGRVQCELLTPISEQQVKEDNCSSCKRKAYIGVYPAKDQVRIHGQENATDYSFQKKWGISHHCSTCGVFVYSTVLGPPLSVFDKVPPERKEHVMAVYHKNMNMKPLNVRCMEGLDIQSLNIEISDDGDDGYDPPEPEAAPSVEVTA